MYIMTTNPFTPGAGHTPKYIAGRASEVEEFKALLLQDVVMENLVLTGLRGIGKTVLLTSLRPVALEKGGYGLQRTVVNRLASIKILLRSD